MKILIIDSSYLVYKSYFAFSKKHLTIQIDGETITTSAIFGFIREIINLSYYKIYDFIILAWDSPPYIKKDKYPTYKDNRRKDVPRLNDEKEIIKAITYDINIPSIISKGYEGEEIASSLIERLIPNKVDLYTNDEDCYALLSNKTNLINSKKAEIKFFTKSDLFEKYNVTPKKYKTMKALTGCTTDNVNGVEKVGPVTASWLVNEFGTIKNIISNMDEIEKLKPHIAKNLRIAYENGTLKTSKYLTKINKPNKLNELKPQTQIGYEEILEFIEARTLLSGTNKMLLKFIKKKQAKYLDKIRGIINVS